MFVSFVPTRVSLPPSPLDPTDFKMDLHLNYYIKGIQIAVLHMIVSHKRIHHGRTCGANIRKNYEEGH